jgi:hypothetical protein
LFEIHLSDQAVLIILVFSVAGLITALAAAVVTVDKLASAWHHSESTTKGSKPRGSRCARVGSKLKRSKDCPVIGRKSIGSSKVLRPKCPGGPGSPVVQVDPDTRIGKETTAVVRTPYMRGERADPLVSSSLRD